MSKAIILAALGLLQALLVAEAYYDRALFKSVVYDDHSNDDAINMNAQQLLERSNYSYEEHYTVADDGYITLMLRVINPLVKREHLRGPPVMLYHGGLIDQTAWILSSSIQHHPEPWPRSPSDGPMSSSNRSLGFMLANNGYDVWLMGSRGANRLNQGYTQDVQQTRAAASRAEFALSEDNFELVDKNRDKYWAYGLDDIIRNDFTVQIDKVLEVSGAKEVSMLTFSLSTPTSMAFLAAHPGYAHKVRVYFQLAPAIAADHFTSIDTIFLEKLCPILPTRGIGFFSNYWLTPSVRKLMIQLAKSNKLRYSVVREFLASLFGPSQKYHVNLERNFLAHIFLPLSFKSFKHYCQNSLNKRLTHFDYGAEKNTQLYGQMEAPAYNISHIEVQNWVVFSGTYDGLADATTVQRLIETTSSPKPVQHIVCDGFSHLGFQAAVENDKYVNLPILDILNRNSGAANVDV